MEEFERYFIEVQGMEFDNPCPTVYYQFGNLRIVGIFLTLGGQTGLPNRLSSNC